MTIDQARKLLGKKSENVSDEKIIKDKEISRFFADILIDKINNMTEEEKRLLFTKKS